MGTLDEGQSRDKGKEGEEDRNRENQQMVPHPKHHESCQTQERDVRGRGAGNREESRKGQEGRKE